MGVLGLLTRPFVQLFTTLVLPPANTFASQTIIITGANTGLGLETARHIVSLGASRVILGVRTLSKGQTAKADIEATTGRLGVVDVWQVDLESFASVKAFTARAKGLLRLDVAILNAGLASGEWNMTSDGWERQLQINVLSTALMGLLLLPQLTKTGQLYPASSPHLVLTGSDMHFEAKFRERNAENSLTLLNDEAQWEKFKVDVSERYAVSKLLNVYVTLEVRISPPIIQCF